MKLLAIEKEVSGVQWSAVEKDLLAQEAHEVYGLYKSGILREHYFNEEKNAVLILECENKAQAQEIIEKLPLVKHNLITFDIMELHPYTGYERIIKP